MSAHLHVLSNHLHSKAGLTLVKQNVAVDYVGVDCHKDTIACYINGKFKEFRTDFKGFKKALEWVRKIEPDCAWAIEGAYSYGLTLSINIYNRKK